MCILNKVNTEIVANNFRINSQTIKKNISLTGFCDFDFEKSCFVIENYILNLTPLE